MRNLFTINVKTKEHGFDEFLIRKSENTLKAQFDENAQLLDGTIKKKFAPLLYISFAAIICGVICIAIFLGALEYADFTQAYSTVGWALYIGITGIALFVVLIITTIIWFNKFMANPQVQNILQEQTELEKKIAYDLRVPEGCAETDIMCRPYKLKNGKEKYQGKSYENLSMWVFAADGNLCLADICGVWAVPLSSITSINSFPGHATLSSWNKEEKVNSPKYRRQIRYYKGNYIVKGYYSLQFICHGEEWEILIPAYDIDVISELTGKYPTA